MATEFANVVKDIDNMFKSGSVYSTWLKLTIGTGKSAFTIETSQKENNYFMSFRMEKNGSGQANKFTIDLVFVPKIIDSNGSIDANELDKKLVTAFSGDSGYDSINDVAYFENRKCTILYGYGSNDAPNFRTKEYEGIILDYTVEMNDGALFYTITATSSLIVRNEELDNFPGTEEDKTKKPSTEIKEIVNNKLSSLGYKFDESSDMDDKEVVIPEQQNVTVFQRIASLTKLMVCSTDSDDIAKIEHYYDFVVNDSADGKTISIVKYPQKGAQVEFIFNWMNPMLSGSNIVLDFKTSFRGTILYNLVGSMSNFKEKFTNINSRGLVETSPTSTVNSVIPAKNNSDIAAKIQESTTWAKYTKIPYTGELSLMGIPYDIPIGTVIKIVPLILGSEYHMAGNYMITKTEDVIDNSGFTTSLQVFRIDQQN